MVHHVLRGCIVSAVVEADTFISNFNAVGNRLELRELKTTVETIGISYVVVRCNSLCQLLISHVTSAAECRPKCG